MVEWWTYRPSDFLMFSASSHARLLEQFNRDVWPLHGLMLAVGLVLIASAASLSTRAERWIPFALAGVWTWVGWGFLWSRFAEINTAAMYLAIAFGLQAAVLLAHALQAPARGDSPRRARIIGTAMIAVALLWPLAAPFTARTWDQAEFFGLAPEPTALATLGWLIAVRARYARWLSVIPVVSLVLGIGLLWLLYGPDLVGGG